MKLSIENTGKLVEIDPPEDGRLRRGELWQGEAEDGTPVMLMAVMLVPLVHAKDPRWDKLDADRAKPMPQDQWHPEVERFPGRVLL